MASTNIQVFYLRQQNKDTKNFSVYFTDFFALYYGGDLISNNWNDNILKKKFMLFFFQDFVFDFFFRPFLFPASRLFFFQLDSFLYFLFFLFFLILSIFFCNFEMDD